MKMETKSKPISRLAPFAAIALILACHNPLSDVVTKAASEAKTSGQVASPVFSPAAGPCPAIQPITITDSTPGAVIRYSTSLGSSTPPDPTSSSPTYAAPLSLAGVDGTVTTIKAMAFHEGMTDSTIVTSTYTVNNLIMVTPTIALPVGCYGSPQTVALSDLTPGASIRYTLDGSSPTESLGTLYTGPTGTGPFSVSATAILKVIAYKSGSTSAYASAGCTFPDAAPVVNPPGGAYGGAQSRSIGSTMPGSSIRYTTDGSTPSPSHGTLYTAAVSVPATTRILAIAYESGWSDSPVATARYTLPDSIPVFSPGAGSYAGTQSVSIATTMPGASIRYTTDGSDPTESTGTVYSSAISVASSETLKAIAYGTLWASSGVASAAYKLPVASPSLGPSGGTFSSAQNVSITSTTPGASIRYTTDGSNPSASLGTLYTGTPGPVTVSGTLKAIAFKSGWSDSTLASAAYLLKAAAPGFSPGSGIYAGPQTLTLSRASAGASMRYTTDGSLPTASVGTLYSGPFSVSTNQTIWAIAYKAGWTSSDYVSALYSFPGSTWTSRTLPNSTSYISVAFGNGKFVAISNSIATACSADGITWTPGNLPSTGSWRSVAYGNSVYVAVSLNPSNKAASSSDGINWTARTLPAIANWESIAFGNGKFVAIDNSYGDVATSTDGITWNLVSRPNSPWVPLIYANSNFLTVAPNSTATAMSNTGTSWLTYTLPSAQNWRCIGHGSGKYITLGYGSNVGASSTYGNSWTAFTLPAIANWNSVSYGGGVFVTVAQGGTVAATSTDGIAWTSQTLPASSSWNSVAYGNGKFVAVASTGIAATSP